MTSAVAAAELRPDFYKFRRADQRFSLSSESSVEKVISNESCIIFSNKFKPAAPRTTDCRLFKFVFKKMVFKNVFFETFSEYVMWCGVTTTL